MDDRDAYGALLVDVNAERGRFFRKFGDWPSRITINALTYDVVIWPAVQRWVAINREAMTLYGMAVYRRSEPGFDLS